MDWNFDRMIDAGAHITVGSDGGAVPDPPLFRHMVNIVETVGHGDIAVGREALCRMMMLNGAIGVNREKELGSTEVGKKANFIVMTQDILSAAEQPCQNQHLTSVALACVTISISVVHAAYLVHAILLSSVTSRQLQHLLADIIQDHLATDGSNARHHAFPEPALDIILGCIAHAAMT